MTQQVEAAKKVTWPQWVGGSGVTLLLIQLGFIGGWSSPYIAQMTSPNSTFPVSMTEASWVVSSINLGRLIGAFLGSMFVYYLGSKTTILITTTPLAVCWLCTTVATDVWWLYVSRFNGGLAFGMAYCCFPLYVAEIADPKIRGALVTFGMCGMSMGNLLMCIMGTYLKMEITGAINLSSCIVLMVLFLWVPESPHHLVRKQLAERAKASIVWYHRDCNVEAEYNDIADFVATSTHGSFFGAFREFRQPAIRRAMLVAVSLYVYSQLCGINNIVFYMENILRDAGVSVIRPALVVIMVTSFGIVASVLSLFLIDRFGRRVLMSVSCTLVAFAVACLGAQFQLIDLGVDVEPYQSLPIFAMVLFQVAVFIGLLSVPSTVIGELFPASFKCQATCIGSFLAAVFAFVSTSTYQPLIQLLTMKFTFWLYSLVLLTAVPVTLTFLPETKGKSLQQIQNDLLKSHPNVQLEKC